MTTETPPRTEPVEALFRRFRDGRDIAALAALFDRTAPDLFRIALSVAPDAATAEEAVQETFLAVLEDPSRCDPSQPLMPWLVGVLRHKVVDARRRARRVPDPLRLEPRILPDDPADAVARSDAVDRVRAALDRLPEPYRSVALLRWEYGLEPGEIAHARGEPPGTVRSTLSRALERLRKDLGGFAALALVLGVRPPAGLASIRRTVLARAGAGSAATASVAGIVVGGVLLSNVAAGVALVVMFVAGGLLGGGIAVAALGTEPPAAAAGAPPVVVRSDDSSRVARPPARRAAPPVATDAPSGPETPEATARRQAHTTLDALDGGWDTANMVGRQLARMTPQRAVVDVVRDRWPSLASPMDRKNLLKGFDYDASSELRFEVLDLGANDPDPTVQGYALTYFETYAGRRFLEEPSSFREWRASVAGRSPAELLDACETRLLTQLREAAPDARADLLDLLGDVLVQRGADAAPRPAVADAAIAWLADTAWIQNPRPLIRVVGAARPTEAASRDAFTSLLARGAEGERRAILLAGRLRATWTYDAVVARLASPDRKVASAAAWALADIGELRAVRALVETFSVHRDGPVADAVAGALGDLTGVTRWNGKSAAWWEEWWSRNRAQYERPAVPEEHR